jgi:hypothetical protein
VLYREVTSLAQTEEIPPFEIALIAIEMMDSEHVASRRVVRMAAPHATPTMLFLDGACDLLPI